jgi:NAD(P)-dependent dehydrogenase (short-subunit alcohol dehydrogenase family)
MSTPLLAGAHALVTGAASGIGAATAWALAEQGARVTLAGRNLARLQAQAQRIHAQLPEAQLHAVVMDVADTDAVAAGVQDAQARFGAVQVLVNNAGQAQSQPFAKMDAELWQRMLAVNLSGCFHVTQAVLPGLQRLAREGRPGRIINIASTAGLIGYAYVSAYVAAKHGVVGLTKSLALELARQPITVNALCPGYTDTDIVHSAVDHIVAKTGQTPEQARQALSRSNPQGALVQPEAVAHSVLWLCAPGSQAINGQAIAIDGGECAG